MGNFAGCCSLSKACGVKGQEGTVSSPSKLKKAGSAGNFKFSHAFAVENPGRIDDYYDVSMLCIGRGLNGIVYRAYHKDLRALRAVKSVPTETVGEFPREVIILRSLDHPNIVKLYETFQDAERTYMVMELCTGGGVVDAVMRASAEGAFNEQGAATYFEQVLTAVNYLHSQDLAHRDIRLENLLLQDNLERSEVKLIDFGLTALCEADDYLTTMCGHAHYTSPEMIKGCYTKQCDIWSCGILLYILFSGSPPFDGQDDADILKSIQDGEVDFPDEKWSSISSCAKDFVRSMLNKDPVMRPHSDHLVKNQFIRRGDVAGKQPLPSVVKALQSFKSSSQLKKVCLTVIAKTLSKKHVEDLRLYFKQLDKNGDGTISKQELVSGLKQVSKSVPGFDPKQLKGFMDVLDSDSSGAIDYTEFVAAALDRTLYEKRDVAWAAFRAFDTDASGRIDKQELRRCLENAGQVDIKEDKLNKMMNDADKNKDGMIDFEEFMDLILEE